jgi:hypothetical protein
MPPSGVSATEGGVRLQVGSSCLSLYNGLRWRTLALRIPASFRPGAVSSLRERRQGTLEQACKKYALRGIVPLRIQRGGWMNDTEKKRYLEPTQESGRPRQPGGWEGRVRISEDFDAPLPAEVQDAFEGRE